MENNKLKTRYMGIELKNPVIIGSSNLVSSNDNLLRLQDAGAAAIVYKSLFEEQVQLEQLEFDHEMEMYSERNAEMTSLFPNIKHAGPEEHLLKLRKAKESLEIPVIGSLNAVTKTNWIEYAKQIAQTGVDGLEINFYAGPGEFKKSSESIENEKLALLQEIKSVIKIPVAVKISPYYTNTLDFINRLDEAGADSVILFNRLFQPEIDIEKMEHVYPFNLSGNGDYGLTLRYAGLLYGNIKSDIVANGGIFSGDDIIKLILAGASSVQVVSAIYKHKTDVIKKMLYELETWMNRKQFDSIEEFKGKLAKKNLTDPFAYKRAQYVDIIMNSEVFTKKYELI
ncbi:MAG: dihydroorotate dehydrogenase-like protein [Bacteroidales bacterium]|nr:dihydroorotate dehydrogenase-like protein [Bacteroidales bacterium]